MGNNDTSDKLNSSTEQVGQTRDEKGRITGGTPPTGFHTNPERRNPGGWRKEVSFSYQYKRFMAMTSKELAEWATTPSDKRTVVEDLAYARVVAAKKSLPDVKELTDRTEGNAPQMIGLSVNKDPIDEILTKFGISEGDADDGQTEDTP